MRVRTYAIRSAPACLLGCAQTRREQGQSPVPQSRVASAARPSGAVEMLIIMPLFFSAFFMIAFLFRVTQEPVHITFRRD